MHRMFVNILEFVRNFSFSRLSRGFVMMRSGAFGKKITS